MNAPDSPKELPEIVRQIASYYDFTISDMTEVEGRGYWLVKHSESNCDFFWTSVAPVETFLKELKEHFEEIGREKALF